MKERLTCAKLAELTGKSDRTARRWAETCKVNGQAIEVFSTPGPTGIQYEFVLKSLPQALQDKYEALHTIDLRDTLSDELKEWCDEQNAPTYPSKEELQARWEVASLPNQKRAIHRVKAMHFLQQQLGKGLSMGEARKLTGIEFGCSPTTTINWGNQVKGVPEELWAPIFLDGLSGQKKPYKPLSKELMALIGKLYLKRNKPTMKTVRRSILKRQDELSKEIQSIDRTTLKRQFDQIYPYSTQCLEREGPKVWEETCWPSMKRDRSGFKACELLIGDGHRVDYMVVDEQGREFRPMLTFWQDGGSNYLFEPFVGEVENTDSIRRSFIQVCKEYGVPRVVSVDNGMGYASKQMSGGDPNRKRFKKVEKEAKGVFQSLGIHTIWAQVAHGQSKPIERAFGTLEELLKGHAQLDAAYRGNCPKNRPETGRKAIPIDIFKRCLREAVFEYNTERGRRSEGVRANGRSYMELFKAKQAETTFRKLESWEETYCLYKPVKKTVPTSNAGCFTLNQVTYKNEALVEFMGTEIQIRYNPDDYTDASAYTLEGRFICRLDVVQAVGYLDDEHKSKANRLKQIAKKAAKKRAQAYADLVELETDSDRPPKRHTKTIVEEALEDAPVLEELMRLHPVDHELPTEAPESDIHRFMRSVDPERLEWMKKPKVSLSLNGDS